MRTLEQIAAARERDRARHRVLYAQNPEIYKARTKARYPKTIAARKAARLADPEAVRAKEREWRAKNLEKAREKERRYKQKHPEKARAQSVRRVLRKYGLTPETFAVMLEAQKNLCAVCEGVLPTRQHRHIDHCHATGKVRGILCQSCNLLLGFAKDSPRVLSLAIAYLERNQ